MVVPKPVRSKLLGLESAMVAPPASRACGGPQSSGLVVGKEELIETTRMNGCSASSRRRGMKVGKDEITGLLAAVELFLDGSDEDDYRHGSWRESTAWTPHVRMELLDVSRQLPDSGWMHIMSHHDSRDESSRRGKRCVN
jgi:seryl-tRNA(Sec) selenium transferase